MTTQETIAIIGAGAIGISFTALHLRFSTAKIRIYDNRPDLNSHLHSILPGYIDSPSDTSLSVPALLTAGRLTICSSLAEACDGATIIQEQGPERLAFKRGVWEQVEKLVGAETRLWSSTSGIAAGLQGDGRSASVRSRLLVVHPFNPPHIMPLLEIVPSAHTSADQVDYVRSYFAALGSGHRPVVLRKEVPGFVGNRLAFVLFREACSLVDQGVVDVKDLDTIMESSLGPRWAVTGPFKSYGYGGGRGGLGAFLDNLQKTMGEVWDGAGMVNYAREEGARGEDGEDPERWRKLVVRQTDEAYGLPTVEDFAARDRALKEVLEVQERMESGFGQKGERS